MSTGFYADLIKLVASDPKIIRYRAEMAKHTRRIEEVEAKAQAEVVILKRKCDIVIKRERIAVDRITRRFLKLRRKELGLSPLKSDQLVYNGRAKVQAEG